MIFDLLILIEEEGEKRKFVVIYETYQYKMLYIAYRWLKDADWAEDAVQESFLFIAKNIRNFGDPLSDSTKRYIYMITKNKAIDVARKFNVSRWETLYEEPLFTDPDPADLVIDNLEKDKIISAILRLKVSDRECLELNLVRELPPKKIAEILNISHSAAKQRVVRAKRRLIEELKIYDE